MRIIPTILFLFIWSFGISQIQSNTSGNWNNSGTWVGGIVPSSTDDIEIISGHEISLSANASVEDIIMTNGKLQILDYSFSIYGNISGAYSDSIISTASSQLSIEDKGNALNFTFPKGIQRIQKISINRIAGATCPHNLDLDDNVPNDSIVLILSKGIIELSNSSILYLNSKSIKQNILCSDSSFIDGIVQRNIPKTSGIYVYPVGDDDICRPFGIGLQNGNGDNIYEIEFIKNTPVNNNNVDYSKLPGGISQLYYWRHEVISGANTQRRIYYELSDFPNISNANLLGALTLANTDGVTDWTTPTTGWTVDTINNWVQFDNANASNNEYWTFGSILSSILIEDIFLPITLLSFNAHTADNQVLISWETASEINNAFFTIERSQDGVTFTSLKTILGAGNSNSPTSYSFIDTTPLSGLSYYRLKQTDYNSNHTYSAVTEVQLKPRAHISFSKISSSEIKCIIESADPDEVYIAIIRTNGQIINQKSTIIFPNIPMEIILHINYSESEYVIIYVKTNSISQKIKYKITNTQ
ncbi:MAG: hypothetical protein PF481_03005 [Bacteroidales bacterium]|jgi:hypothetical protein|nr:hypothetical protein [Bacteroidales bacterium]